ncbi:MAG: carboxymuconolactone decarboxylase family protein [Propionibacteriaceae bacterium]|nr:carboxymuconolactone decarboxylase family protein [Propionibacteriaceae bacterium]
MTHTVNISKLHPQAYKAQVALDAATATAAAEAGLDPLLIELIKIRVSQINGCAFCLRMHTRDALAKGETIDRLSVVAAWWESQYFSPQEQAALAIAEQVTNLDVPARRSWDDGVLTDEQQSAITWLAISINSWNRIAIMSHYPVAP